MALKTINIPQARKDVECSSGAPECESDTLVIKVTRKINADKDQPGEISLSYDPEGIANSIRLRKVSGPSTAKKTVGPIPCSACSQNVKGARYQEILNRKKDLETLSDEQFMDKWGVRKSAWMQDMMLKACDEYMSSDGLKDLYRISGFRLDCRAPQKMTTGSLTLTITASMTVYWYTNNCQRGEKTLTSTKKFTLPRKTFSIDTLAGGDVMASTNAQGANRQLFGIPYQCPQIKGTLFCGTCYYEKTSLTNFLQPTCVDVDAGGSLGGLVGRALNNTYRDAGGRQPYNPFAPAIDARNELAQEIDNKITTAIDQAVQELIGQATAIGQSKSVDGKSVCGVGYELKDSIGFNFN